MGVPPAPQIPAEGGSLQVDFENGSKS